MIRFALAFVLLSTPCWAQDATPVVPVAAIDAPAFVPPGGRLVLLPGEGVRTLGGGGHAAAVGLTQGRK